MSHYRDNIHELRVELHELTSRLAEVRGGLQNHEDLRRQEAELVARLSDMQRRLEEAQARDTSSLLDNVRIASPCSADWNAMRGDEQRRACGQCKKDVFNIAQMTRAQAETLLRDNREGVCLRIYRRADGTVMTSDCGVGQTKKRRRLALYAVAGSAAAAAAALNMYESPQVMVGALEVAVPTAEQPTMGAPLLPVEPEFEMGDVSEVREVRLGKVSPPDPEPKGSAMPPTPVVVPTPGKSTK